MHTWSGQEEDGDERLWECAGPLFVCQGCRESGWDTDGLAEYIINRYTRCFYSSTFDTKDEFEPAL